MIAVNFQARQKKARKPQKRSLALRAAIQSVVDEYEAITVRQLYYQMEVRGYVRKNDADYDRVQYHCLQLRRDGTIPYWKIRDLTRVRRLTPQYNSMHEVLARTQQTYRRNYWVDQPVNVEVWCEKEALLGILAPICDAYGIVFVASKGFDSESLAYESAEQIRELGKPTHIYYFGDHDPSGWWIVHNLEEKLRGFGADVRVFHEAVHPWQVATWNLPTRRAKKSDTRYRGFVERFGSDLCTELDALPPDFLQGMVRRCIEREIDPDAWTRMRQVEKQERLTLASLAMCNLQAGAMYRVAEA